MQVKKLLAKTLFSATIVLGMGATTISHADTGSVRAATPVSADWLFVQTAQSFKFDGKNTMTLVGANPNTIAFADRPERISGQLSNQSFVSYWGKGANSFQKDPPNATVTYTENGSSTPQTVVVELSNPRINGNDISWNVRMLGDPTLPVAGQNVSMFIDWWYGPFGGVCHYGPWGGVRCVAP